MSVNLENIPVTVETIGVDYWIDSVADAPVQRNTMERAKKAKHLKQFAAPHVAVNMARLPNKNEYKLDAHTRAFVWKNDAALKAKIPNQSLIATVYHVKTVEEICALYNTFDSQEAVEGASDKLFGSMRRFNLVPQSNFLNKSKFVVAIKLAHSYWFNTAKEERNIQENTKEFISELTELDGLLLDKSGSKKMITPAVICYLMAQKKHDNPIKKEDINDFFDLYMSDEGTKEGKRKSYVQIFSDAMNKYISDGDRSTAANYKAVQKGLACIEGHLRRRSDMVTKTLSIDPRKYSSK